MKNLIGREISLTDEDPVLLVQQEAARAIIEANVAILDGIYTDQVDHVRVEELSSLALRLITENNAVIQ